MSLTPAQRIEIGNRIARIRSLHRKLYGYANPPEHRGLIFESNFYGDYDIASDGGQGSALPGSYDVDAIDVKGMGTVFETTRGWIKEGPWVGLADEIMSELEETLLAEKKRRDEEKEELERQARAERDRVRAEREAAALADFVSRQPSQREEQP